MTAALYERAGDEFHPTTATRSPWHPDAQHGGPPTALAVRAIEEAAGPGMTLMRLTANLLHEIPMVPLRVTTRPVRPGRKVALHEAELTGDGGTLIRAVAWAVRRAEVALPEPPDVMPDPPPPPESLPPLDFRLREYDDFFGTALEKRLISGHLDRPGRAAAWFRFRMPIVAGETASPLQQLTAIADSGNGISWALPFDRFLFTNTDLSLAPYRPPAGEWFAMESVSHFDPSGRGTAYTSLFDTTGWLGRSTQALYLAER